MALVKGLAIDHPSYFAGQEKAAFKFKPNFTLNQKRMVLGGPDNRSRDGSHWSVGKYIKMAMRQGNNKGDLLVGRLNLLIYIHVFCLPLEVCLGRRAPAFTMLLPPKLCFSDPTPNSQLKNDIPLMLSTSDSMPTAI